VIVPFRSLNGTITAFYSDNGGASWSRGFKTSKTRFHRVAGDLRTSPLPSAEIAADGTVYVAWEDCRFRKNCTANDIVFSTSTDGVNWSDPARVPIDPISSSADHFIPGLAVDRTTSGAATHLALTYYFYPDATCTGGCQLDVGYVSSPDGGAHWSNPTQLAGPMTLGQIAQTSQGPMVGDYISTSFSGGNAATVIAVGKAPTAAAFDEAKTNRRAPARRAASSTPSVWATLTSKVPSGSLTESGMPARAARWTIASTPATDSATAARSANGARTRSWGTPSR